MKVGVLTLHSQINYGGVLQAFALQQVLRAQDVDSEIIDYWLSPANTHLTGYFLSAQIPLWKRLVRLPLFELRDGFVLQDVIRRRRTQRFLHGRLRLSTHAFCSSAELESVDPYDAIIVGSDQVWNPRPSLGVPNPFLLGDVGPHIRRVSYAASFGVETLPVDRIAEYRELLSKFARISVREWSGLRLVHDIIGCSATKVLDPTLVVDDVVWWQTASRVGLGTHDVLCYWLGSLEMLFPLLRSTVRSGRRVVLMCEWSQQTFSSPAQRRSIRRFLSLHPRIRCFFSAGPAEFVQECKRASCILSDSFHALMFATIFRKPVMVVLNSIPGRSGMRSRVTEFCQRYRLDSVISEEVPERLLSISQPNYGQMLSDLNADRQESIAFLRDALS